jgi:hypothetical protein
MCGPRIGDMEAQMRNIQGKRRPRPAQNSMKKKIDWEIVGVVLFIFTLFPFVWFYRELIQQTYEIRRNHGRDR